MLSAAVQFLETNAFSEWVLISPWGFPWLIALHSVGMGIAAGLGSACLLRKSGYLTGIPESALPRLFLVVWVGFVLNLVTGVILLITRISEYLTDPTFLVKMAAVIAAAICMRQVQKRPLANSQIRALSAASIACWALAVAAGRWIAYLSGMYG